MAAEPDSERRHQRRRRQHTVVVLFTRDLRVHDHPALAAACASAGTVVPLFVLDPAITDIPAASANRMAFLCESLADLRASLIRRGADLYVRHGDAGGSEPFVRQLCWRDFHHQVLAAFPALPTRDYRRGDRQWCDDRPAFDAWRNGHTGVPIVDAGMRQLLAEGFMHNRARMLTASFLVKELGIDWRWGAHHFRDWLVDADVANNSGNWQWIAGTGNDTRPNRRFNLIRQARRHDPDGTYVRRYVPELADIEGGAIHEPWRLPGASRARFEYPDPLGGVPGMKR